MTNEEIYEEMQRIGALIDKLHKQKKMSERNKLCPRYRELKASYKFPFVIGDDVYVSIYKKRSHKIKSHVESDNHFVVVDDNGWLTEVCGTMLTKIDKDVVDQEEQIEQLSLF